MQRMYSSTRIIFHDYRNQSASIYFLIICTKQNNITDSYESQNLTNVLPFLPAYLNLELWYHFNCHAPKPGLDETAAARL
jgi:hypothetical protein